MILTTTSSNQNNNTLNNSMFPILNNAFPQQQQQQQNQWLNFNKQHPPNLKPQLPPTQQSQPQIDLFNAFLLNNQLNNSNQFSMTSLNQQMQQPPPPPQLPLPQQPGQQFNQPLNFLQYQNQMGLNQFALNNLNNINQYQIDLIDNFKNVIFTNFNSN
jgi:hypothetical protein